MQAREMAQLAKCSTHEHELLSSMPRTHVKYQGVVAQVYNHNTVEVEVGRPRSSLAIQLHKGKRFKEQGGYSQG